MTAPMAPEELAAMLDTVVELLATVSPAWPARQQTVQQARRLVRRLQAERDAAPPVGQTPDEFALELLGPTAHPELRRRFAVTITARDAEVARAAAEREREACAKEADKIYDLTRETVAAEIDHLDDGSYQAGPAAYATGMNRGALDIATAIRSRAPAPAGEGQEGQP